MELKEQSISVSVAIVIAGALIAFAVYASPREVARNQILETETVEARALENIAPVTGSDHIRGRSSAPVVIVEYSDTECPFCKRFHETMRQIMTEYGATGDVAWVYRHFPLDSIHPKADKEAEALECANEQGGNDAFWLYADRLFEITPSNNGLDESELPTIASYVGLDPATFATCLSSGKYASHVEDDTQNAIQTGGTGTPWSIIVARNGKKYPLNGAQPYESVRQLIELALKEK